MSTCVPWGLIMKVHKPKFQKAPLFVDPDFPVSSPGWAANVDDAIIKVVDINP